MRVWKCQSVKVWECESVKVSPMEFLAWVNIFLVFNIFQLAEIPKLYVELWESVWIGVWKYHQWNSEPEYILFGTQYVKNGWKRQIVWKFVWKWHFDCMNMGEWVYKSVWKYFKWIFQLNYILFDTKNVEFRPWMTKIAQPYEKSIKIVISLYKSVNECVKVLLMIFWARVHFFGTQ